MSEPRIHRFDNGLRLATVAMPGMASVATGFWTDAGSRHEHRSEHGLAHFVEHMLFKGTPSRSSEEISRQIEGIGATIDGFTVEDHTAYHAKGPAERFAQLFDVLSDFYRHPSLDPGEIESEKRVIHEEIAMVHDQPAQLLEDLASEAAWGSHHPLGRSITGTETSLARFRRDEVLGFFNRTCTGANTVVSVAGDIDHHEVADHVAHRLAALPTGEKTTFEAAPDSGERIRFEEEWEQEQAHLSLAFRAVDRHDPARFAHQLLNVVLGENMSSRLFQEIRERRALCYEVQSDLVSFADAGLVQVYLALSPENLDWALEAVSGIVTDLSENGVGPEELEAAKAYVVGQSRIALENTGARMSWGGECLLSFDEWRDPEEVHRRIRDTTGEEVREAARRTFRAGNLSTALIGTEAARHSLDRWLEAAV